MNIGQAIKFCRQQRNMTQPQLAEQASLSASYISVLEQGKRDPSLSALESIAQALQIPLSVLIFVANDPSEIESIPAELSEKLSAATLKLLRATADDPQPRLI